MAFSECSIKQRWLRVLRGACFTEIYLNVQRNKTRKHVHRAVLATASNMLNKIVSAEKKASQLKDTKKFVQLVLEVILSFQRTIIKK